MEWTLHFRFWEGIISDGIPLEYVERIYAVFPEAIPGRFFLKNVGQKSREISRMISEASTGRVLREIFGWISEVIRWEEGIFERCPRENIPVNFLKN